MFSLRSALFIVYIFMALAILGGIVTTLEWEKRTTLKRELQAKRELVDRLMLTDLAIWTEARYTRHPSQTDFFSPFQDYPGSFDHFPAGSVMSPNDRLLGGKP